MVENTKRLAGKVAVITGAGRGIGRSEALAFAAQGAKVVVNDLGGPSTGGGGNPEIAQAVVDEIHAAGGEAVIDTSSVSTWEGGRQVVQTAIDAFGRIDILSNNAGIARALRIDELSEVDWDTVSAVNLKGYVATIRHAAPHFIKQKSGVIINKSSPSGFGQYAMSAYCASKEGVIGLTRSVARDLGEFGVRCNALRPVTFQSQMGTPALHAAINKSEELGIPFIWNRWTTQPVPVAPSSENIAAVTVWLCLDDTSEVNGRDFYISGGELGIILEPELGHTLFQNQGWNLENILEPAVREYLIGDVRNRFTGKRPGPGKLDPAAQSGRSFL